MTLLNHRSIGLFSVVLFLLWQWLPLLFFLDIPPITHKLLILMLYLQSPQSAGIIDLHHRSLQTLLDPEPHFTTVYLCFASKILCHGLSICAAPNFISLRTNNTRMEVGLWGRVTDYECKDNLCEDSAFMRVLGGCLALLPGRELVRRLDLCPREMTHISQCHNPDFTTSEMLEKNYFPCTVQFIMFYYYCLDEIR